MLLGSESGITLIEIIVVMIIVAILGALSTGLIGSSKATGRQLEAVAVGGVYARAAEAFARDHGNRFPTAPGVSGDWAGGVGAQKGPISPALDAQRYYVNLVPESVQRGSVVVQPTTGSPGIRYQQVSNGTGFRITVLAPKAKPCEIIGGDAQLSAGQRACSKR